jgi:methyl-accepting chemotaxis protein
MLQFMQKLGVGKSIGLGFLVIALVLAGAVGISLLRVQETSEMTYQLLDLRAPTAQASLSMQNGMNRSLAALRGWMLLGNDKFRTERNLAWDEDINPALQAMKQFAVNWTDPTNVKRLDTIESNLKKFEQYQQEIEDIAQTVDNTPAMKILFTQAAPQAAVLATEITRIIDLEAKLQATAERKALLGMMADVRGTTGLGLASIRAYLLSGDNKFADEFETYWAKNTKRFNDLSDNARLLSAEQRASFDKFSQARSIFHPLPQAMFEIRGSAEWNLANAWLGTKAAPTSATINEALDGMIESQQGLMATDIATVRSLTSSLLNLEWIFLIGGLLVCAAVGTFIGLYVKNGVINPITRVIEGLSAGAEQVESAAGQLSGSSQAMAEGASEQASGLEETSASLEEMASMAKQNAENSNQGNALAAEARTAATKGSEAMERMVDTIGEIKKSSDETAKIIKVIDEIAFQTNLLALNAAVEAARAGEAGKGFAVVAEEVRNLAQRSAEAARNTNELIDNSKANSERGVSASEDVSKLLEEVTGKIHKVTDLMGEISGASDEQSQGVDQVNQAVAQMDVVTQRNASSAEESASASEELSAQSKTLNELVQELGSLVGANQHKSLSAGSTAVATLPSRNSNGAANQHNLVALHDGDFADF